MALFNRTGAKTTAVVEEHPDKNFKATYTIEEFVESIEKPRRILLMVKAGPATDATIQELLPHLDKGDILIDGGNTFFKDTMRRNEELANSGINFIGTGVSGGEEGALKDLQSCLVDKRSLCASCTNLRANFCKAEDGAPCVTYIGPNGAGHYVKMVHNGIEYGDMQLIAESYDLMKNILNLSVEEMADIFKEWNQGELDSYLIEITADILTRKDDEGTGKPVVDVILMQLGIKEQVNGQAKARLT